MFKVQRLVFRYKNINLIFIIGWLTWSDFTIRVVYSILLDEHVSFILIDCLRVMEKKCNVVIKPYTSMGDATQEEEDVAIATPVSVESEIPLSE